MLLSVSENIHGLHGGKLYLCLPDTEEFITKLLSLYAMLAFTRQSDVVTGLYIAELHHKTAIRKEKNILPTLVTCAKLTLAVHRMAMVVHLSGGGSCSF